jgi:phosphoglycerol transferase
MLIEKVQNDSKTTGARRHLQAVYLLVLCAAIFAWLLLRNHGLSPAIFADEWYYSKMSRLQALSDAIVPSYLYLWVFRGSNACGDGFLDCVRIGNELFFVAAAPFIYLTARRVAGKALSLFIAVLAMLAPFNLYTSFFMPEAMYYFGFAVLSWISLGFRHGDSGAGAARLGLAAGLVLGLMSLVKVHALFLLPSLCLYLLCAGALRGQARWLAWGLLSALIAAAATLAVKFGLGYLLAGKAALSLFGSFYSGTANANSGRPLLDLLKLAFINGRGHLMAIAVLLALPLAMIAQALASPGARARTGAPLRQLQLYAFLMLGAAVGVTVLFTASIAATGPGEVLRLHLRYYNFVFPLLLIVAAGAIGQAAADRQLPADKRNPLTWTIAGLLAIVLVLAVIKLPLYTLSTVDGPDIQSLQLQSATGKIVVAIDLLVLFLWARASRLAAPLFLFAAVPLMTWLGLSTTSYYLSVLDQSWGPDKAGKFAHHYVPEAERGQMTVAATEIVEIMRAQFHIDNADVAMLELPKDAPLEQYQMPIRSKWLLVLGKHPLPAGVKPVAATQDYALVKMDTHRRPLGLTRFSEPLHGGLVDSVDGLSVVEPWGRWSEAKQVVLHFSQPLPKHAGIVLKAQAFGPNAGLPFVMRVGGQEQRFRVPGFGQDIALPFVTDGAQRSLSIEVPQPTAPRDVGPSVDVRKLGIGLIEIEVSALDD